MEDAPALSSKKLSDLMEEMKPSHLGTLAFNMSAIAWIGLNLQFHGLIPFYMPGSYVHPNLLNIICGAILLYSVYPSLRAIRKGSLIPAVITLTFTWSFFATLLRALFEGR